MNKLNLDVDVDERALVFLPDGRPTQAETGDVLVWEKTSGILRFQRVGVGNLLSPMFEQNPISRDATTAKKLEHDLMLGVMLGFLTCYFELIDESEDRAIFHLVDLTKEKI